MKTLNVDKRNSFDVDLELNEKHTFEIPTTNHMPNGPKVSRPPVKCQKVLDVTNKFIERVESYISTI